MQGEIERESGLEEQRGVLNCVFKIPGRRALGPATGYAFRRLSDPLALAFDHREWSFGIK